MDYIPLWDEGVILKKSDKLDSLLILELIGVLFIPVIGFMVLIWDFSPFSFLLFLLSVLFSYEITLALKKHGVKVYREGVEVNEKLEMLPGGAISTGKFGQIQF